MADEFLGIPDWLWWENVGRGLAVADVDTDGRPDLVVLAVDAAAGTNAGFVRIGHGFLDGAVTRG